MHQLTGVLYVVSSNSMCHVYKMQTKPAFCTGLKSGAVEVSNFPLPAQDESKWAKVRIANTACTTASTSAENHAPRPN